MTFWYLIAFKCIDTGKRLTILLDRNNDVEIKTAIISSSTAVKLSV